MSERSPIRFRLTTGERPNIVFPAGAPPFDGRRSARGTVIIAFPPPYSHITIAQGERVGPKKWAEIRRACEAFGAEIR